MCQFDNITGGLNSAFLFYFIFLLLFSPQMPLFFCASCIQVQEIFLSFFVLKVWFDIF